MILAHINVNPELLIKLVVSKLIMWGTSLGYLSPLGKSSASIGRVWWEVLGDKWHGMVSRKSRKYFTVSGRVQKVS